MQRFLSFLVASSLGVLVISSPAGAAEVYPIVFPVDGSSSYSDTYGAPRDGDRTHEGTDIMAPKMTPVVAAASGTVGWVSDQCCAMELMHDDGYRSRYIHLNNDTPGTDDGQGWGFAPGITSGVRVDAGQLIGYVGDSGNAELTSPHLHFELRYPSGEAFNSYPSLLAATTPDTTRVTWHLASTASIPFQVRTDLLEDGLSELWGHAAIGDFDGDGDDELAIGNGGNQPGWDVAELDGGSQSWSSNADSNAKSVHVGDFDGDGDDDIAVFRRDNAWSGYRSSGSEFADERWGRFGGTGWTDQLVGDFDGDGDADVLTFHPPTRNWWMTSLAGDVLGSKIFTRYGTPSGWQTHLAADIDGDGADELLSFHPSNGTWWSSNLGGTPQLVYDVSTNSGWQFLTTADLDGDDTDELIMFHPSNGTWWAIDPSRSQDSLYLWGTFTTRTGWVVSLVADVDTDGRDDLLIRHAPSGRVWAVLGGSTARLSYLGDLVIGETEGEWVANHPDGAVGLIAVTR